MGQEGEKEMVWDRRERRRRGGTGGEKGIEQERERKRVDGTGGIQREGVG